MTFVRLSKFVKAVEECESDIDRLLFTFKNVHKLEKVPPSFNKMVFKHIFEIARISNFNVEELMFYESEMKRFSDHANALAYAEKKGVMKGEAKGETRGIGIGVMRTAKNMLKDGLALSRVARITKLPLETVKALR
jgi:predicted transposase/invertase (TIGR01784 family)